GVELLSGRRREAYTPGERPRVSLEREARGIVRHRRLVAHDSPGIDEHHGLAAPLEPEVRMDLRGIAVFQGARSDACEVLDMDGAGHGGDLDRVRADSLQREAALGPDHDEPRPASAWHRDDAPPGSRYADAHR